MYRLRSSESTREIHNHTLPIKPQCTKFTIMSSSVQALPWLQLSALKSGEEERKERVQRLALQKAAAAGVGFGPPPQTSSMPAKVS